MKMKRIFLLALTALFAVNFFAQKTHLEMQVWADSMLLFGKNISKIDSITFIEVSDYTEGALASVFSISETQKVRFAKGNLQYQPSTKLWRFAENQYDCIGYSNEHIASSTYTGWLDLFGWGTSGWSGGVASYWPTSTSTNDYEYYIAGSVFNDMTGPYAKADWGVYNAISNGGNQAGLWRTLTYPEWDYLFYKRPNASNLWDRATINGTPGLMLLPDDWVKPEGITIKDTDGRFEFNTNSYDLEQWKLLEDAGAVFLPCGGVRHGTTVQGVGQSGQYWSATPLDDSSCRRLGFYQNYNGANSYSVRHLGQSVRLAQDVK